MANFVCLAVRQKELLKYTNDAEKLGMLPHGATG